MKWKLWLSVAAAVGGVLLARSSGKDIPDAMMVAGIESVRIDGRPYFFGFNFSADQVVSPLFPDVESMAAYAAGHLMQRDGRKDADFWRELAEESLQESALSDLEGTQLDLRDLRRDLTALRSDPQAVRALTGLKLPEHLIYLLESNCQWPEDDRPAHVTAAAQRLGLEMDDTSGWLELTTAYLSTGKPQRSGDRFDDAATVYLWYVDTLLAHQRHDWSHVLGLQR